MAVRQLLYYGRCNELTQRVRIEHPFTDAVMQQTFAIRANRYGDTVVPYLENHDSPYLSSFGLAE